MSRYQHLVALILAYEHDERIECVETTRGNQVSDITLETSLIASPSVDRLLGTDGAGVELCFDLVYEDKDNSQLKDVVVRRGHAQTEYGTIDEIVV